MNLKLLEYALLSVRRRAGKHMFVFLTFTILIAAVLSVFTVAEALKKEAGYSLGNLPDITVQKITGGRQQYIPAVSAEEITLLPGVVSAVPRIWGLYRFEYLNTNLTIVGLDIFDPFLSKTMSDITDTIDVKELRKGGVMFTGEKLNETIKSIYGSSEFSFQKPDGEYITLKTAGTFKTASGMLSADTVITDTETAAHILGIPPEYAADIAVNISNPQEISTAAEKISNLNPSFKVTTSEIIKASYQNMFDYKSGLFLLFFTACILTFAVTVFDRLSGISGEEKRETAILKAIGWDTGDVLRVRLYESAVITLTAFPAAVVISLAYVYLMQAPGLKTVFIGHSYLRPDFIIPFSFDLSVLAAVFFVTVPVYTASVIIPSWRAASSDPGEVIR